MTSKRPPPIQDSPEVLARIHEALPLVDVIAGQLRRELRHDIVLEDLVSHGREGLLSAARSFDPDLGVPFRRWANLRVRGAMLDGLRKLSAMPRGVHRRLAALEAGDRVQETLNEENATTPPTSAEAADTRLTSYLAGIATAMAIGFLGTSASGEAEDVPSQEGTPEELLERAQLAHVVKKALAARPEAERRLVEGHYFEGASFDEVARGLGLSRSWASRLHARAIEAIAKDLKKSI